MRHRCMVWENRDWRSSSRVDHVMLGWIICNIVYIFTWLYYIYLIITIIIMTVTFSPTIYITMYLTALWCLDRYVSIYVPIFTCPADCTINLKNYFHVTFSPNICINMYLNSTKSWSTNISLADPEGPPFSGTYDFCCWKLVMSIF